MPSKEARRNALRYCVLRDRQLSLYDAFAKRHGMLASTLLVVNALYYAKDGITQRDIAAQTFQSKQAVCLIVKKLRAEGSVTLAERTGDAREKVVTMTEAGRERYEARIRHVTWAEDTAMAALSPEEQAQLVELSRRFTDRLVGLMEMEPQGYREEG